MSQTAMHDDTVLDAWWKDITLDDLTRASGVIAQFQASILADARSPVASAGRVARAIVLRRLIADDRSLEVLVQLAKTARVGVRKAVIANTDVRGEEEVLASRRMGQALRPVLLVCGQMLVSRTTDEAGKEALDLAEQLREVLFDYNLLDFRYGART